MGKKNDFNRRNFLKLSAAGTAGAFFTKPVWQDKISGLKNEGTVIKRKLGNTGLELPVVSMGVMRSDNPALVKAALDMGIQHFDTAQVYQGGKNENMLGEVFKACKRETFTLGTKIIPEGVDRHTGVIGPGATRESITEKMDISLQRLQMDYVDILYLHAVGSREVALHPPFLEALKSLKQQGKIRFAGVSTHMNEPEVIEAISESDVYDVVLTAYNFTMQHRESVKEKIALAAGKGKGIIAMKTMAGGFLDKDRTKPVNCRAALKWVLQDTNVHTTIPGIIAFDQLIENFGVMENLEMTDEEKAHIETARLQSCLYCDQCRQCTASCKHHLPVNEIMRAYMYAYGYRQYEKALALMEEYRMQAEVCRDCSQCTVSCPKGFIVADRIAGIARILSVPRDFLT
ncbi:MAG: aldo/keto reductase [Bacteroidales bacterium]|nr:aldo/keto reductase [Bacteroidales bacterium]